MTSDVIVTLAKNEQRTKVDGRAVHFSAVRCFAHEAPDEAGPCLEALADALLSRTGLAVYGRTALLRALIETRPALAKRIEAVIDDDLAQSVPLDIDAPVLAAPEALPNRVRSVFLAETGTHNRWRMQSRLRDASVEVIDPDLLTEIAPAAIPQRAWVPIVPNIYPVDVPEIRFEEGLDLVLLDCPARNLALMPNGLSYVHNALKPLPLRFQTFDLDIVAYHRFHIQRLFDEGGRIVLPSGRELPVDPWQAEHYDLWTDQEVLAHFAPLIEEAALALIRAKPKVLGLSLQQCNEHMTRALVNRVREAVPDMMIVVGGFSCYNADIGLKGFPEADYMCIGEADLTVGPLMMALARGERPANLPGVQSRYDRPGVPFVPAPMPHNLDEIEFPKYEWADLDLYRNFNHYQLTPVIASRGCRWSRCTFCAERFYWRIRSPGNFVDELEWLVDQGCTLFMFNESDLNGMPEMLLAICDEIIRRDIKVKLTGQLRIHKKSDRAFFDKLRKAGFVALRFGVDGFSENTLRLQKKGYTTEMVSQNLKDCWEAGIYTEVNWVIGVPGETDADVEEGIELILKNRPYIGRLANINPLILANGGVYWLDPDAHGIRFREAKDEIYRKYRRAVPAHLWYSVDPYIDAQVRTDRFKHIVRRLHESGFPIGAWAARVIDDIAESKDHNRAGPAQPKKKDRAAETVDRRELVDETEGYRIYAINGRFIAIPKAIDITGLKIVSDSDDLPGAISGDSVAEVLARIEKVNRFTDSRGRYDPREQQRRRGDTYLRADSALGEDSPEELLGAPVILRHDRGFAAFEPDVLAHALEALGRPIGRPDLRTGDIPAEESRSLVVNVVSKGAKAELLQSIGQYSIVKFDGRFYGVPQGRPIVWEDAACDPDPAILVSDSIPALKEALNRIQGRPAKQHRATAAARGGLGPADPSLNRAKLLKRLGDYRLVSYEGWVFGIPARLGEVDLSEIDLFDHPEVIRDVSRDVVENEIAERQALVGAAE